MLLCGAINFFVLAKIVIDFVVIKLDTFGLMGGRPFGL